MDNSNREDKAPNTVQQQLAAPGPLVWQQKKVWGAVGNTHYTEVTIGNDVYRYVIDQPRQHDWQARGWVNGSFCMFRDRADGARTLRAMKDLVSQHYAAALDAAKGGAR